MTVPTPALEIARERLQAESAAIDALARRLDASFLSVARLLRDCPGKVVISGSGTSGTIARRMAHIFSVSGTPAVYLSAMDALHGASGAVCSGDVVLLISNGGASAEVVEFATIARDRGARVVALTAHADSPLARHADQVALVAVDPAADIGGVIATGITLAQAAWGDALAEVVMRNRGYTWDQFMTTHPAGAVGQRANLPADLPFLPIDAGKVSR
ncbi:SIS domain-containing protein [Pseudactinotalea sp. HY158]|uniref:KpsF/GutQ family sugar-phosphate isomerase n=1 Tax=Pseudactinotalea sp. HY158 TaxID=2654547 RepID=UPI00129D0115|nr:SIS domain-containing protein [Pseudactinotalea sp. HY158]QGH70102.1 SIS domain-containing protein [Pseudactinotalea sp. HY158]